ncbi:MAG: two component transcriptional regulator, LytTR family [Bacteroidetes bacterium]|jgi:DNA-binding LytR/AlgR family response regulator|nr:two component transcriptional regulator, LytTR family [Bacteroidota bacterium]
MKVLIVEDEIIIAAELSQLLQKMGYTVSGMAVNYSAAVAFLTNEMPDIVMIDINLGGSKTGIDLGKYINETYKIPFIYLTSAIDKSTVDEALKTKPGSYLLKPFDKIAIYSSIEIALQSKSLQPNKTAGEEQDLVIDNALFIKQKELFVKVMLDDILYFKSDKNYIEVVTADKMYLIRSTMVNLLAAVPEGIFVQSHKSYSVNIKKISAINQTMLLIGPAKIPISDSFREKLTNRLKTFT